MRAKSDISYDYSSIITWSSNCDVVCVHSDPPWRKTGNCVVGCDRVKCGLKRRMRYRTKTIVVLNQLLQWLPHGHKNKEDCHCNWLFTLLTKEAIRAGHVRLIRDQRCRTQPWCQNADARLRQLTTGRNADAALTFLRHSGIYIWFPLSYSNNNTISSSLYGPAGCIIFHYLQFGVGFQQQLF